MEYSLWSIDVPEFLSDPYQLYARLSAGRAEDLPTYAHVSRYFEAIFRQNAGPHGILLRHQRLLWRVRLPE